LKLFACGPGSNILVSMTNLNSEGADKANIVPPVSRGSAWHRRVEKRRNHQRLVKERAEEIADSGGCEVQSFLPTAADTADESNTRDITLGPESLDHASDDHLYDGSATTIPPIADEETHSAGEVLEEVLPEQQTDNDRMRQALKALRKRRADLEVAQGELDAAKTQVTTLRAQLEAGAARLDEEMSEKATLQCELQEVRATNMSLTSRFDKLNAQFHSLRGELEATHRRRASSHEDLASLRSKLDDAQMEAASMQNERDSYQKKVADLESQLGSTRGKLNKGNEALGAVQKERDEARRMQLDMEAQLKAATENLNKSAETLVLMKSQLSAACSDRDEIREAQNSLVEDSRVLKTKLEKTQTELAEAKASFVDGNRAWRVELDKATSELKEAKQARLQEPTVKAELEASFKSLLTTFDAHKREAAEPNMWCDSLIRLRAALEAAGIRVSSDDGTDAKCAESFHARPKRRSLAPADLQSSQSPVPHRLHKRPREDTESDQQQQQPPQPQQPQSQQQTQRNTQQEPQRHESHQQRDRQQPVQSLAQTQNEIESSPQRAVQHVHGQTKSMPQPQSQNSLQQLPQESWRASAEDQDDRRARVALREGPGRKDDPDHRERESQNGKRDRMDLKDHSERKEYARRPERGDKQHAGERPDRHEAVMASDARHKDTSYENRRRRSDRHRCSRHGEASRG